MPNIIYEGYEIEYEGLPLDEAMDQYYLSVLGGYHTSSLISIKWSTDLKQVLEAYTKINGIRGCGVSYIITKGNVVIDPYDEYIDPWTDEILI